MKFVSTDQFFKSELVFFLIMKVCKICKIEKSSNMFRNYTNKRNGKVYTRSECQQCLNYLDKIRKIRKSLKVEPMVVEIEPQPIPEVIPVNIEFSGNSLYFLCKGCNTYKLKEFDFYNTNKGKINGNKCKVCYRKRDNDKYILNLKENGGGVRVLMNPGQYNDIYQKENTYRFLTSIGWKLNEEDNIWYKPNIKLPNGKWINLKNNIKVDPNIFKNEIFELKTKGYSYSEIGKMVGISSFKVKNLVLNAKN